jgi:hypothetical protein
MAELGPLGSALSAPAQQVLASEFLYLCAKAGVLHAPLGFFAELRLGFERTVMGDERICSVAENRVATSESLPQPEDWEERSCLARPPIYSQPAFRAVLELQPWQSVVLEQSRISFFRGRPSLTLKPAGNTSCFVPLVRSFELEERTNEKTEGFTQEKESDFQTL